jgi:hypothetical protein
MAVNRKRLVFFERWFDPVAEQILSAQEDIELVRLRYVDAVDENWGAFSDACGYQVSAHRAHAAVVWRWRSAGALPPPAGDVINRGGV